MPLITDKEHLNTGCIGSLENNDVRWTILFTIFLKQAWLNVIHWFPWLSLVICLYHPPFPVGFLDYILWCGVPSSCNGYSDGLRNRSKRVRTPVTLLRSLSAKYTWERYERPYPPSYGLNSTTTVLLGEWLWH